MSFSPSTVARAIAQAAADNMANLATAVTTWQTLIAGGNLTLAAFVDGLRTAVSVTSFVSFSNGWSANPNTGYWKDAFGVVHVHGSLKSGTVNAIMTNLPAGFRPAVARSFPALCNNGTATAVGAVVVNSNGDLIQGLAAAGFNNQILDGITFLAEQ
jgi:hypothetical protein